MRFPDPFEFGHEVLAKATGSKAWPEGGVKGRDGDGLYCSADLHCGTWEERLARIFIRHREGAELVQQGRTSRGRGY